MAQSGQAHAETPRANIDPKLLCIGMQGLGSQVGHNWLPAFTLTHIGKNPDGIKRMVKTVRPDALAILVSYTPEDVGYVSMLRTEFPNMPILLLSECAPADCAQELKCRGVCISADKETLPATFESAMQAAFDAVKPPT